MRRRLAFTTASDGSATVTDDVYVQPSLLYAVMADVAGLADTADITISVTYPNGTDYAVLTLTNLTAFGVYYPRLVEHDNTGTALDTTTIPVVEGKLKFVVASGGNALPGALTFILTEL